VQNVCLVNLVRVVILFLLATTLPNLSAGSRLAGVSQTGEAIDPIELREQDWPWWRGQNRNGVAPAGQKPPLRWSKTENILWSSPIPGRGHGSPTVVGDRVYLATAEYDKEIQSVLCYDRLSGVRLWKADVHRGGFPKGGHRKSNLASASVASDGRRLFINFLNSGSIYTTALDLEGRELWQTKVSGFVLHQGFGSSPAIYNNLVIVSTDNRGGGALVALSRSKGEVIWRQDRPKQANYTSPIILRTAGREQLLLTGANLVSSFDPLSGARLWEIEGSTTEVVTSVVTDGQLLFASGGYPRRHVSAIRTDGSGEVVWEKNTGVYVPSMLVHAGHVFLVTDSGIARCWRSQTGEEVWRRRLGSTFSSSLVLVGEHMFATSEDGETFVFRANPEEFQLVARNKLGENVLATVTICDSRIYMRVGERTDGQRRELLYCIAERKRAE
jgi:outer membrane protein assembly factor BamB